MPQVGGLSGGVVRLRPVETPGRDGGLVHGVVAIDLDLDFLAVDEQRLLDLVAAGAEEMAVDRGAGRRDHRADRRADHRARHAEVGGDDRGAAGSQSGSRDLSHRQIQSRLLCLLVLLFSHISL
jgi:hypothetical protein